MNNEFVKNTNDIVETWRTGLTADLKSAASVSHDKFKIRSKSTKEQRTGAIFRVGITMERHAIFYEKGVGRGRGIDSGKTQPKPTYNPVIHRHVPILADQLAIKSADLLSQALIR